MDVCLDARYASGSTKLIKSKVVMTNPIYYYLSGTPAKIEEYLLAPERLADRWRDQSKGPNLEMNLVERIAKYAASAFFYLLSMPLKHIAKWVEKKYRTSIPQAVFEERKKYWDPIIESSQGSKDHIVKELIRAKIPNTKYTKIFWDLAFNQDGGVLKMGYFASDMVFCGHVEAIKQGSDGPYLILRQGRTGSEKDVCPPGICEVNEPNIQANFKKHLISTEFERYFSKKVIDKFDFLLLFNTASQCHMHHNLNEAQIRRLVAKHLI